jgi:hypothetical protein
MSDVYHWQDDGGAWQLARQDKPKRRKAKGAK